MKNSFDKIPAAFFLEKRQVGFYLWVSSVFSILLFASLLQGCSGNGFHLRNSLELAPEYQTISLENLPVDNNFRSEFEIVLENAGGKLIVGNEAGVTANSIIRFENFNEGKRVIAYTSERKAREYLLYLKFNYEVIVASDKSNASDNKKETALPKRRINIDKSYLYDPDFALGKAEEEKLVKKNLYQEAARLILLHLQYAL